MKHYSKQLISDQQLIALARQAGLCFPDCWALDATEEDQELDQQWIAQQGDARYKQILEESERLRQERLDQLRSFACSIIQWNQEQFPMKSDAAAVLWAAARLFQ